MSHDDETEIVEAAKRTALYYMTLVAEGLDPLMAVGITQHWVLAQQMKDRDKDGWKP